MTLIKSLKVTFVAVCLLVVATAQANVIPITNGSFETPPAGGSFQTYFGPNNSTSLPGWTINGSIDHIGGYWQAADGNQSLDMNGSGSAGTISQVVNLPGGFTQVQFDLAGNPDNAPLVKTIEVSLLSSGGSQTFTFNVAGKSHTSMGWILETANFGNLAAGSYTLQFRSLDAGSYGPALDNVSVNVPDGGFTLVILAFGIMAVGIFRKMAERSVGPVLQLVERRG